MYQVSWDPGSQRKIGLGCYHHPLLENQLVLKHHLIKRSDVSGTNSARSHMTSPSKAEKTKAPKTFISLLTI